MIQLQAKPRPPQLTDDLVAQLTADFKATQNAVWNKLYIKTALLEISHGKCCYCECNIKEESKYMEVEHFYAKSIYPEEVLDWRFLLPACKRCNAALAISRCTAT